MLRRSLTKADPFWVDRGERDLPTFLSQRSNGLAFSPHHFISSTSNAEGSLRPPWNSQTSTSLSRSAKSNPGPRTTVSKTASSDGPGEKYRNVTSYRVVSSLLNPSSRPPQHIEDAQDGTTSISAGRVSSSGASAQSYTSSFLSRKRKFTPIPTLDSLPAEILDQVSSYLPQETLYALLLTNSTLNEAAAIALYESPKFASTYRFAQFVSTITHVQIYATMVRFLDLSMFGMEKDEERSLAGWREWKYRSEPLYSLDRPIAVSSQRQQVISKSTHPRPNPFLEQWSTCRDVPIGAVIHVLEACKRIKSLDLSYLSLAADYRVNSADHLPTAFTLLIFVSDLPKSNTWRHGETRVLTGIDIVNSIAKLPQLTMLQVKKGLWLTTALVARLVDESPRLEKLSLEDSGMRQGMTWAIKGSKDQVRQALRVGAQQRVPNLLSMTDVLQ